MNPLIQQLEKPIHNLFIYALVDPNTNMIRYVGQTTQGFDRIREHFYKCDKVNKFTKLYSASKRWIKSLRDKNQIYSVIYLHYCTTPEELNKKEIEYIAKYRHLNLLNHEIGGTRTVLTEIERQLISERTKLAMNTPEMKEKCRQNLKRQRELGLIKPVKWTDSDKKRISLQQESNVVYIKDENNNIYRGYKDAAMKLNISMSAVSHCLNGRTKTARGHTLSRVLSK